jgi:nicotinamidase-related amidase
LSITVLALIVVAMIAAIVLAAVGMMVRSMFIATRGKKISTYLAPRKALVVLDIQEGYSAATLRQPVASLPPNRMISTVNRLIDKAAETGMEVVYIRQVFSNNLFVRLHGGRRQGRVIVDRRIRLINKNDFEKNRTDAFSSKEFEQFLIDNQVNELYLVGVDAAYCVYYTALGALNRGYKVTVVEDAVLSRNSMAKVLERFRRKGIAVVTSGQLIDAS